MVRVIEVHESAFARNDLEADSLRRELTEKGVFMLNVMSGPGSGKTTLLTEVINRLKGEIPIALMDVDIETELDAGRIAAATGVPAMQIHNGGLCHIDAEMTGRCVEEFGTEGIRLLILENIGNLVCPAEFDTGAHRSMMLLSVPEGDDKPLKYPLMFQVCDLVVITKVDTLPAFDFDVEKCRERILRLNPRAKILTVSAKTGEGMEALTEEIRSMIK